MFKELFTESEIKIQVGKEYITNNGFTVKIIKQGGIESMGIQLFSAEIIDGPNPKMLGKTKKYNQIGKTDGVQKQSDKHTNQWSIKRKK